MLFIFLGMLGTNIILLVSILIFLIYNNKKWQSQLQTHRPCVPHKIVLDLLKIDVDTLKENVVYKSNYRLRLVEDLELEVEKLRREVEELKKGKDQLCVSNL